MQLNFWDTSLTLANPCHLNPGQKTPAITAKFTPIHPLSNHLASTSSFDITAQVHNNRLDRPKGGEACQSPRSPSPSPSPALAVARPTPSKSARPTRWALLSPSVSSVSATSPRPSAADAAVTSGRKNYGKS